MDAFITKLILSFLIGGIFITLVTMIAEKAGTKLGGFIGGLPSTLLITLLFVGLTQSKEAAAYAANIVPAMSGVIAMFIVTYILLSKHNFVLSVVSALFVWLVLAFTLVHSGLHNIYIGLIILIILMSFAFYILEVRRDVHSHGKKIVKYTFSKLLFRGVFTGLVIVFAVYIAKISSPIWGGVLGLFPAVMLSTIIITHFEHGKEFSNSIMKIMVFSSALTMTVFAFSARYFFILLGIWYGTLVSFLVALIIGYINYEIIIKKLK